MAIRYAGDPLAADLPKVAHKPAKRDKPRKGGDGKRTVPAKAPGPAGADEEVVRLIFPCSKRLADRVDAYWHEKRLGSRAAAIRALLEEGLKP